MYSQERSLFPSSNPGLDSREELNQTFGKFLPLLSENYAQEWQKHLQTDFPLTPETSLAILSDLKDNNSLSRPRLCALVLQAQADLIFESGKEFKNKYNDLDQFMVLFDIAFGVRLVASHIFIAEETIRGNPDLVEDVNAISQAETILLHQFLASHLRKDNSGLNLLQKGLESLNRPEENHPQIPSCLQKDLVITGYKFGMDLYKQIYPLTK